MRDGVELSANIWRPVDADAEPVPAILEMIPYGKDNWRRNADTGRGEWFAARGYALVRVDVRGTGSSGGVALDEYSEAETADGVRGRRVAGRPAVVHRRRRDVGHQLRGVHRDPGRQAPAAGAQGHRPVPGHRRPVSDRRPLHRRLRHRERALAIRRQPGRDERDAARRGVPRRGMARRVAGAARGDAAVAGRVAPPADRRPVLAARLAGAGLRRDRGGDPQRRRLVRRVRRRGLPDAGAVHRRRPGRSSATGSTAGRIDSPPGPNLDELHEVVRFFDRWLKGESNGADDEPALVWFERDYAEPEPFPEAWPGRWRATTAFPHPATRETRLGGSTGGPAPLVGGLVAGEGTRTAPPGVDRYRHRPTVGTRGSLSWGAGGEPNGLARDLRPDESARPDLHDRARSRPRSSVLGEPVVVLHLAVDAPVATAVVRLSDVAPDGTSAWVSSRHPEPDPSPVGHGSRTAGARTGRGGPRPAPPRRLPVRARASDPGVGGVVSLAGHLALAVPGDLRAAPRTGDAVAAHPPGRPRRPAARATRRSRRSRPRHRTSARSAGRARPPTSPGWRIEEDVIAGTTTVTIHDGGEDVLEDGRRLYAAETLRLTASRPRTPPRATMDARRRLSLARAAAD